ncbi:RxLR effector peptide [Phytophthora palmivora]|uniref:RxLR effector protein n=1 Tax=Phytophthora palmivora TaxID=4796 RepID=A0A2P4XD18_9STRA|nr:RxLR effector peptide [Phytophthora palmivora]
MRPSYVLLLAIATALLASVSDATASGRSTDVSAMTTPGLTGMAQTIGGDRRSLRYHENNEHTDKDGEENYDVEERAKGVNVFSTKKLNQMVASLKRGGDKDLEQVAKRFARWETYGYNPATAHSILDQKKYDRLRQIYRQWKYYGNIPSY